MIDKQELIAWLSERESLLARKIEIVAVGGTAMTLLGLKASTIDIDFCISEKDKAEFEKTLDKRFKVDIFINGYIFSEQLPQDYAKKAKEILVRQKLIVKALDPLDIIITKTARLNARDEEDIEILAKYVKKEELIERFEAVVKTYAGDETMYRYHFSIVLKRFFAH